MALTRDDLRSAAERAGDEPMQRLRAHHEEAYPASRPTPGDVLRNEADRLNQLGFGDAAKFELLETRVERFGDEVELTHEFMDKQKRTRVKTEGFRNYG
ncbi:MAG: hypothetical protein ABJD11_03990 [Gemmatimonadota bacterium]